jgi:hypothetical protein
MEAGSGLPYEAVPAHFLEVRDGNADCRHTETRRVKLAKPLEPEKDRVSAVVPGRIAN